MPKTDIGKAFIQIVPSAEGIKSEIEEILGKELGEGPDDAGKKAGAGFVSRFKAVIMAAGLGKIISQAISEGSELQQNLGGTEAVFGNWAENVKQTAAEAYKNMGMSASEYMATANKMGSLFQGAGIEQEQAYLMTAEAMQRAADVASVMGISQESAMESIAGAAKGNFTMMDNLGVAMNATTLEAYAAEKGMKDFSFSAASNAEKAQLAMEMFLERTQKYAGNFAQESNKTISGSLGQMKSAFQNVLGSMALGEDIQPSLDNLVTSIQAFGNNILPVLRSVITTLLPAVGGMITTLLPKLLPVLIKTFVDIITQLASSLPAIVPPVIESLLGALISNAPELLKAAVTITDTILHGLDDLGGKMIDIGADVVHGIWNGISGAGAWLWEQIKGWASDLVDKVKGFFDIGSPSKLFRDEVGANLAAGLGIGFVKGMEAVNKQIDDSLRTTYDIGTTARVTGALAVGSVDYRTDKLEPKSSRVVNLYIDGIKYNTDEYVDEAVEAFVVSMIRKSSMFATGR